jgi:hypothetical protein
VAHLPIQIFCKIGAVFSANQQDKLKKANPDEHSEATAALDALLDGRRHLPPGHVARGKRPMK